MYKQDGIQSGANTQSHAILLASTNLTISKAMNAPRLKPQTPQIMFLIINFSSFRYIIITHFHINVKFINTTFA